MWKFESQGTERTSLEIKPKPSIFTMATNQRGFSVASAGVDGTVTLWDTLTGKERRVVAKGQDMHGEPLVVEGSALLARAVQHETDHLDGILFIDRLDPELRKEAMRQIREAEWFGEQRPQVQVSPHSISSRWL